MITTPPVSEAQELVVTSEDAETRLDSFLCARGASPSRAGAQRMIDSGSVLVEGRGRKASYRVQEGERVTYRPLPLEPATAIPEEIPLRVLYEDSSVLVIDKPKGMVVHPAAGNPSGTLVNAVLGHASDLSGVGGALRPGIVHRLDKDTSGVIVVAKSDAAHLALAAQFKSHSITRRYLAIVHGGLEPEEGTVSGNIGRHPVHRKKMAVVARGGRHAVTHYRVLERFPGYSFVELRLETGRTHQIRVHLAHLGHPVAGDPVYGPKRGALRLNGQALHAAVLGFVHPVTGEYLEFRTDPPGDFQEALRRLRRGKLPEG